MKPSYAYRIDLSETTGEGDFPCPGCGVVISPDDCSEMAYTILEPRVRGNSLEEVVILCNRCGSEIHLVGFILLESLAEPVEPRFSAPEPLPRTR